ncbi:hypothetical protein [Polaromonas sp. UC242_47]|uniref:hypothetical protein n=1 Tax=Polaromonas sp. UC242_47 TaxID=3374626 RepID=UPI00379A4D96
MRSSLKPVLPTALPAALLISLFVAGCSLPMEKTAAQAMTANPSPAAVAASPAPPAQSRDAVSALLEHADRTRGLQGTELAQEIARLGDPALPADQLRLAITLTQTRQLYDLVRAQELVQRVLTNSSDDARPLHGLARLLATRFADQRRVEDQLDRQNQQLRDLQRRVEQTQDKLDALKEIERSLTSRPPAAPASSPNGRNRP